MILADRDIEWYLARGLLRIEPLSEDTIRENGVDLRFGREFCRLKPTTEPVEPGRLPESALECVELSDEKSYYVVQPWARVLATTLERVCLPDDLVGLVNLRSTYARTGISIPPTVIDAGFCGQVTIEIIGSTFPVILRPGARFLHVVFVRTTTPVARPYRGKYQNQQGVTPPKPD